jgi:hypothetical protein
MMRHANLDGEVLRDRSRGANRLARDRGPRRLRLSRELPVELHFRNARMMTIPDGTCRNPDVNSPENDSPECIRKIA